MCKLEIIRFQIQADFLVCSLLLNRKKIYFFNFFFLSERKRKSDTLPDRFIIRSNINTAITSEFNFFLSENCGHFKHSFQGSFFFFFCLSSHFLILHYSHPLLKEIPSYKCCITGIYVYLCNPGVSVSS